MSTILILVRDLGFQVWLAQVLESAQFLVVPAKTPSKASKLLAKLGGPVDVVIVDPALAGAAEFVHQLRTKQGYLHVLSVCEQSEEAPVLVAKGMDVSERK